MELQTLFFFVLGILAIATAIGTVASKNPVVSAVTLVGHFVMLAGLYLTLQAQFMSVLQVLVYAGAIMVLVIFVIMLLNLGREETLTEKFDVRRVVAIMIGGTLLLQFAIIYLGKAGIEYEASADAYRVGEVENLGKVLFTDYLFQFEAITLVLLVAVMGALILARRKTPEEKQKALTASDQA
ncbi:MAG: NADH-quinone oxidoreductase subunit J [Candidatus Kapaibacteriales bacterium]